MSNRCIWEGSWLIGLSVFLAWLMGSLIFEPLFIVLKIVLAIFLGMIVMGLFFVGLFELLEGLEARKK